MEWSWEGLLEDGVALCWCPGLPGGAQVFFTPSMVLQVVPPLHCSLHKAEPAGGGGGLGLNQARFRRYF